MIKHSKRQKICPPNLSRKSESFVRLRCETCSKDFKNIRGLKEHKKKCSEKELGKYDKNKVVEVVADKIKVRVEDYNSKNDMLNDLLKRTTNLEKIIENFINISDSGDSLETVGKIKLRNKSRNTYLNSGLSTNCLICEHDVVHICHIKEVRDFSPKNPITEINHISNLVALCPNHHYALDKTKDEDVIKRVKLHSFILNHTQFNDKIRHY